MKNILRTILTPRQNQEVPPLITVSREPRHFYTRLDDEQKGLYTVNEPHLGLELHFLAHPAELTDVLNDKLAAHGYQVLTPQSKNTYTIQPLHHTPGK